LEERGLTLEVNQTARFDIQLQIGSLAEVLEVTASVPLLYTETAVKGDVIVRREMIDIPLNGPLLLKNGWKNCVRNASAPNFNRWRDLTQVTAGRMHSTATGLQCRWPIGTRLANAVLIVRAVYRSRRS
jgi:hypothetical protein